MKRICLSIVLSCAVLCVITSRARADEKHPLKNHGHSALANQPQPVYGYGIPAPYPYGWFGVNYRTRKLDHRGFYGYYVQYGYWQGYR